MERRRALVVAGTLTATVALAGGAMAANLGLLGSDAGAVGDLDATTLQPAAERPERPARQRPRVRVIVQDIPVAGGGSAASAGGSAGSAAPSAVPAPAPVVPQPAATTYVDDDHGEDGYDDHGDEVEDHEDEADEDHVEEPDDD